MKPFRSKKCICKLPLFAKRCYNTQITELPLEGNSIKDCFKLYTTDIGLLVAMLDYGTQADILKGNLLGYKGAIFENLMADFLCKSGQRLYYFQKDITSIMQSNLDNIM